MFRKEQINTVIVGGQVWWKVDFFKDGKYYSKFDANGNKSSREETNYTKGTRDRCNNYSSDVSNKWKRIDGVMSTSGGFGARLKHKLFI